MKSVYIVIKEKGVRVFANRASLLRGVPVASKSTLDKHCWDEPFAYNGVMILKRNVER